MEKQMTEAQLAKIQAEISKLMAETVKINAEARWYPLVIGAALATAVVTLTKLFL
ncbi:hypothetical protein [Bordetella avium]|uniref:hypothetical protein n=1 Tax=Bordetella avium TaxID=521 RepID=UPI000E12F569|nr:hypothetical protein [Bordetella avium]UOK17499.1 hypothetical protein vBBaMIFTN8_34 [Bordetella phage vB_BaM-IFTN8]WQE34724.1 hypothetical protein U0029_06155 [Bordetella avium]SUV68365.1 phage protein [Bordetella avium]